jgi:hypothetical protein
LIRSFILVICCLPFAVNAQKDVPKDSSNNALDTAQGYVHSVRDALIFSAIVPGAGQIYNHIYMPKGKKKAFWKVPLVYAGLGATGYFLFSNQQTVKELKTEYTNRLNGGVLSDKWSLYDNQGILTLFQKYQNQRDLSILGVGLVYLFQLADAGIEAHFVRFDISPDLTMSIYPSFPMGQSVGIGMKWNFTNSAILARENP